MNRVRAIVSDLRSFSRVEEREKKPIQLNRVINGALNMAFHEIKYRARIVKDFQDVPDILGNEGRLSQVFLNLLVNAAHAIEEGVGYPFAVDATVTADGTIEGSCAHAFLQVEVEDIWHQVRIDDVTFEGTLHAEDPLRCDLTDRQRLGQLTRQTWAEPPA